MPDDPVYPIYSIHLRWVQDSERDPDQPCKWWPFDPGPGRIWNSMAPYMMYREDPGEDEVRRWAVEEFWPKQVAQKDLPNPTDLIVELSRYEETWCPEWFSHKTFDVGQGDGEVLASFHRYVMRYEHMQDYWPGEPPEGYRCLMGAEDRWRWCGSGEDGARDTRTPPPCRCKHCKAQGVIRIGH